MTHYSEGICSDGAAILKDGSPMPVEEIVAKLNRLAELEQEEPKKCEHCGLPAEHLTVFQCIDDLWEHVREERAKAVEKFGDKYVNLSYAAQKEAQAIREGRE